MPRFSWRGTDDQGGERRGELEAAGVIEASAELRAQGILTLALERADPKEEERPLGGLDAFAFFNRSLAEMTRLGFPLPRAVREISSGLRRGRFRAALEGVEAALREGKTLDEAVAARPDDFPPHYRFMLKAGAAAGNLPAVLAAVAGNTEAVRRARRALADALAYPAVVLAFGALVIASFLVFFVPIYQDMYRHYGFEPSYTVRAILGLFGSAGVVAGAVAGVVALAVAARQLLLRTVAGERLLLRLPLLGRIRRHLAMARLLGTLGILLRARAPLVEALPVALGASGGLELAREAQRLRTTASEGAMLEEVLRQAPGVPPGVVTYLAIAERSGTVPRAAEELSELLTEQAVRESELLFVVLMPTALLATGAILLSLFISLVLPYVHFLERLGK